jgi:hypothetical protein
VYSGTVYPNIILNFYFGNINEHI